MGIALIGVGRFDEAVAAARNALQTKPAYATAYRCLAAALAHLGRDAEVGKTVAQFLEIEPDFRISEWVARAVNGRRRCLSTVSAKQGFRNDVSPGGCGRDGDEDGDVDHRAVAGTGGVSRAWNGREDRQ